MEIISNEKYLVDTNVLVYALDSESKMSEITGEILANGVRGVYSLVIAQQNLVELVSVLTKVYRISVNRAIASASNLYANFDIITPTVRTFITYRNLIERSDKKIHPFDTYLIATMLDNSVTRIITADKKDFQGFDLDQIVRIK